MKNRLLLLCGLPLFAMAQTNTFPDSGNVGIGTVDPQEALHVSGNILGNRLMLNDPVRITDWNSIWRSGFYEGLAATNAPESNGWFWGLNMNHGANHGNYRYGGQIAIKNASISPSMYFRGTNSQGAGTWSKVLHNKGSQKISGSNTGLTLEGTGTGNYQGAYLSLKTLGVDPGNEHITTLFINHRANDGTATVEFQRRNAANAYRGNLLFYKDGYGWRFGVAATKTSTIASYQMIIRSNGKVGIGTLTPDSKLTVKGKIHSEEVKVDLSVPAPDYVFKEGYGLRSLEEVQDHIDEHGHLPNIPPAREMEEQGVELGAMDMRLLEKIEELTLYTIAQERQIKALLRSEREHRRLEQRLDRLEALVQNLLEDQK